jgi:hypothetical protein
MNRFVLPANVTVPCERTLYSFVFYYVGIVTWLLIVILALLGIGGIIFTIYTLTKSKPKPSGADSARAESAESASFVGYNVPAGASSRAEGSKSLGPSSLHVPVDNGNGAFAPGLTTATVATEREVDESTPLRQYPNGEHTKAT